MPGASRCRLHGPPTMHVVPQLLVSTILLGGIYALIAVGLTLIFGVMRVVNFAHGEFLMLGMYLAFWAFALLQLDPYVTLVLSLPLIFGFGWLSYRMVVRPVIHASHNVQIFTTVGLSIALQNVALVLWSADSQFVRTGYYTVVVYLGNAVLNLAQLVAFAVAVLCTAALFAFMRWSYTGKVMRATAQDRAVASLMGIDTGRVFALTWAVGVTCVGVAGVLLAPIYPVYPTVGLQFVLIAYVAVVVRDPFLLDGLILILLWGATAAAWNVAGGYAGQVSLGHAAFFGLGAYSAALLGTRWGLSPWIGLLVGAALATAFGILIGFLSNRLRGPYFALATIAFSQVLLIVASRWRGFTSGSEGIPVPFRPGFWTLGITDKRVWVVIVLVLAICVYLVELYLERSRRGFQLAAVREDEDAALSLGVPALWLKVAAIAASAALTAVAGALWAQYVGFVDPLYVFSVDLSVRFALAAILGGIGTALGPFLGAALILMLETYLRARFGGIGAGLVGIYLIIYGTALVVMMRFAPQGLLPWVGERFRRRPAAGSAS